MVQLKHVEIIMRCGYVGLELMVTIVDNSVVDIYERMKEYVLHLGPMMIVPRCLYVFNTLPKT